MSYKSAGTLDKDKMIRRTGITHNGWSRVVVDGEEYYIPGDKLSDEIPEGLPIASGIKGEYQKYALSLLPDFGWDSSELEPLIYLWNRESGWNPNSHNKRSGAHGIPQALPGSKMASEGSDYYTNPEPQIRWGLKYIAGRYGSPSAAWAHFQSLFYAGIQETARNPFFRIITHLLYHKAEYPNGKNCIVKLQHLTVF